MLSLDEILNFGGMYRTELFCCDVIEWEGGRGEVVEGGGKVLLPPSVLESLVSRYATLPTPLLFRLSPAPNENSVPGDEESPHTHVGVLEFVANAGSIVVPSWVMSQLNVSPGDPISVTLVSSLPVATFARFKPQSSQFLGITDPKAVLENSLRKFACLTTGDIFHIDYNNLVYRIKVEETRPGPVVNIIECDMEVDFSAPEGYVEPVAPQRQAEPVQEEAPATGFVPFGGAGQRLDGKQCPVRLPTQAPTVPRQVGIPNYDYVPDTLTFMRNVGNQSTPNGHVVEE